MKAKSTSNARRRLILVAGLCLTLWASWQVGKDQPLQAIVSERTSLAGKRESGNAATVAPTATLQWSARSKNDLPVVDVFNVAPPSAPLMPAPVISAPAPTAPAPEAFAYKYIGQLDDGQSANVFLTDTGDRIVSVRVGQLVNNEWRLTAMDSTNLVFRNEASGQGHTLQIGSLQ